MKKDFVKGIAVGCALSIAIGGASALADTYRKFLEVAYTDIKVVVNGKPTTPRDSDGTPVKPFISSGTTYLPVRSISNALGQNVDWDSDTSTIYIGDKLETDKVNMAKIEPVEGTHILNSSSATFPLRQVTIVPDNRFAPYSSTVFILDATETVTAVNNISTRLIPPTGTPASFAASSSNVTKNNSLYNNIEVIITAMPSPIVKYNSKSFIATIEPNKKLFILVEPLVINPDNTAVRPIPADITTTVAISEYLPNDFLKTSIPITAKIENITAPKIGLIPSKSPNAIPANAECDVASPIAESLLSTIETPIHGAITAIIAATTNALCINAY